MVTLVMYVSLLVLHLVCLLGLFMLDALTVQTYLSNKQETVLAVWTRCSFLCAHASDFPLSLCSNSIKVPFFGQTK